MTTYEPKVSRQGNELFISVYNYGFTPGRWGRWGAAEGRGSLLNTDQDRFQRSVMVSIMADSPIATGNAGLKRSCEVLSLHYDLDSRLFKWFTCCPCWLPQQREWVIRGCRPLEFLCTVAGCELGSWAEYLEVTNWAVVMAVAVAGATHNVLLFCCFSHCILSFNVLIKSLKK